MQLKKPYFIIIFLTLITMAHGQDPNLEKKGMKDTKKILKKSNYSRSKKRSECRGNCFNGYGTYYYENGKYIGYWKSGERHGKGTYIWNSGERYEGEWYNGYRHGKGKFYWNNGDWYYGVFDYGKRTGYGEYYWSDGHKYFGYFKNGKKHGEGTLFRPNGSSTSGTWANDTYVTKNLSRVKNHPRYRQPIDGCLWSIVPFYSGLLIINDDNGWVWALLKSGALILSLYYHNNADNAMTEYEETGDHSYKEDADASEDAGIIFAWSWLGLTVIDMIVSFVSIRNYNNRLGFNKHNGKFFNTYSISNIALKIYPKTQYMSNNAEGPSNNFGKPDGFDFAVIRRF